jgi:complement component 1 Q subcomponent-binding protein
LLGGDPQREIDEEKENLFEGEELAELRAKVEEVFAIKESDSSTEVVLEGEAHGDSIRVKFDVQDVVELEDEEYMDDEDEEEEETEEEEEEEEPEDELPGIRFVAEVTRDNQGLQFEGVASSNLTVERVRFLHDVTADSDKDDLYLGPNFIDLELDVQEHFYSYLAARKVNDDLAQFITQFADLKEQREYLSFLEDTAKFVKH